MTSAHLIDATTMMLRELNSKISHLKYVHNGKIPEEGMEQLKALLQNQTTQLQALARSGTSVSEQQMNALLNREMERWRGEQNAFLVDQLTTFREEMLKSMRERPPSPETTNPHRHFVKEGGIVEDVTTRNTSIHLFFPFDVTVKQPPGTVVLRNVLDMNPMLINPVMKDWMALSKQDPHRGLMSHGLIPAGNPSPLPMAAFRAMVLLDDEFWARACLGCIGKEKITSFPIDVSLAIWISLSPPPPDLQRLWAQQIIRLRNFIVPNPDKGTFNATILLLFGYGFWPSTTAIHPAYQHLQSFFSTHMAGRFIHTFPEPLDTRIPREVFFLWTAVLKWNTTMS